jgi:hypothetical protein
MFGKPLIYWFVFAATAALAAGGRLSLRLLFDTAIVLAPLVAFQVIALALVYWTGRRAMRFAPAVDAFFAGSRAWFLAMIALTLFAATASPPTVQRSYAHVNLFLFLAAIAASIRIDFRYYRDSLRRTPLRAAVDIVVQRAFAWSAVVLYFGLTAMDKADKVVADVGTRLMAPWQ